MSSKSGSESIEHLRLETKATRSEGASQSGSGSSGHSILEAEAYRSEDALLFSRDDDTGTDIEFTVHESNLSPSRKSKFSLSASPSSSDSSVKNFFQMDSEIMPMPSAYRAAFPTPSGDAQKLLTDEKIDALSEISYKSEEPDAIFSPISDITHESLLQSMSPTEHPPIQVMDRPADFDPNRIPSSVFASNSSSPMDWSVASNESLFSIPLGKTSLSRDHFLKTFKSGELYNSGELNKSGELIRYRRPSLAMVEEENSSNNLDVGKKPVATGVSDGPTKVVPQEFLDDQGASFSPFSNGRSNESGASGQSFAFPINKKSARPLCHCSNCSCAFCHCTLPNCCCSCKWPSCCSCSWPRWWYKWTCWPSCKCHCCSWKFCYSWNCKCRTLFF